VLSSSDDSASRNSEDKSSEGVWVWRLMAATYRWLCR
jgi:hypothetical protein